MIDLHTHTTHSDGTYTTEELLKEAEKQGLSHLSITDHDTLTAYNDLKDYSIRTCFSGKIIPGIEMTTTYNGETVEVLGYNFDIKKLQPLLEKNVLTYKEKQQKEFELVKKTYQKLGLTFKEENIIFEPTKKSYKAALLEEIKKYSENYRFFLKEDSLNSISSFARNEIYNPKSKLYVDITPLLPSFDKVVEMIHEADGLAFLAHTFAYSPTISKELLNIIKNYDLDGLECFYTTFTEEQSNYLVNLCKERNMFISGGSDFHGTRKTNHNLGTGNNNLNIEQDIIKDWYNF